MITCMDFNCGRMRGPFVVIAARRTLRLELFKKAIPSASASFVQLQSTAADQRQQALAVVRAAVRNGRPELNFLALALKGKVNFDKVIKMIESQPVFIRVYLYLNKLFPAPE